MTWRLFKKQAEVSYQLFTKVKRRKKKEVEEFEEFHVMVRTPDIELTCCNSIHINQYMAVTCKVVLPLINSQPLCANTT